MLTDTEARDMRDMLIRIETGVKTLIEAKDDHERRIREVETSVTQIQATREEQSEAQKRLLALGMLLAAAAGVVGSLFGRTIH